MGSTKSGGEKNLPLKNTKGGGRDLTGGPGKNERPGLHAANSGRSGTGNQKTDGGGTKTVLIDIGSAVAQRWTDRWFTTEDKNTKKGGKGCEGMLP